MEIVHKPWGYYTVLDKGDMYQVKRLSVAPGGRLSLQSHEHRNEFWVIVGGVATVTAYNFNQTFIPGEYVYIQAGVTHRLENFTDDWVHVIETQHGKYLGEDDIIRYDDIYNRIPEYTKTSEK